MSRAEPLRRLTTATPAAVLALAAAAGYPALTLPPMQMAVPPGRAVWEAVVATAAGATLALARRTLGERAQRD